MNCNRGVGKSCMRPWNIELKEAGKPVKVTLTEDQIRCSFNRFDTNGDGRLSKQELKDVFQSLGSSFPAWRAWRVLSHADANGDGFISEDEFGEVVKYMLKHGYVKK